MSLAQTAQRVLSGLHIRQQPYIGSCRIGLARTTHASSLTSSFFAPFFMRSLIFVSRSKTRVARCNSASDQYSVWLVCVVVMVVFSSMRCILPTKKRLVAVLVLCRSNTVQSVIITDFFSAWMVLIVWFSVQLWFKSVQFGSEWNVAKVNWHSFCCSTFFFKQGI